MIIHSVFLNYLFLLFFAKYHGNFKMSLKNILNKTEDNWLYLKEHL